MMKYLPEHMADVKFDQQMVNAEELISDNNRDRLFIDTRLGEPDEELDKFRKAHVFGAVYAQIRDVFAANPSALCGNLPLPEIADLQNCLDGWQVGEDTEIVVYGPSPALAARAWWVLKWAGVASVRLLNGGLAAWVKAGGSVAKGDPTPRPIATTQVKLSPGHLPSIDIVQMEELDPAIQLLDARDEASFLAGHIPMAINTPAADQWTPQMMLRTDGEIRALYEAEGISLDKDTVIYCGGGVLSAMEVLTLSALGPIPRLFVGSWSQWNKCPERMAQSAKHMLRAG